VTRRLFFIAVSLLISCIGFASSQTADVIRDGIGLQQSPKAKLEEASSDAKVLEAAGLKADEGDGLLKYLKSRTLSESDLRKINDVLKRMSDSDFEVRLKASRDILAFGPAAFGPLRKAALIDTSNINAADFELAHRATEVLKSIEKVPYSQVSAAVVRACGKAPTADTNRVLLAFLPLADGPSVAEEIRKVLIANALRDGKVEPALVEGLKDPSALKRRYAAEALIRGGNEKSRIRIPEAFPLVRAATKIEPDSDAKFAMSFLAATISRDVSAIEELLATLPQLKRGHLWQVEDFLLQLAGDAPPKTVFATSADSLKKAQATWQDWWKQHRDTLNLDEFAYRPRTQGTMLIVLSDFRLGSGSVAELGPDLTELWRINNFSSSPADALMLPDGRLVVAEMNSSSITFRETNGTVLSRKPIVGDQARRVFGGSPLQLQLLPDGSILVICRNQITVMKSDESQKVVYDRANIHDISSAAVLPNGETALMLQNGPNHLVFLDKAYKEIVGRNAKVGQPWYQSHMIAPTAGRLVFTEQTQVVEYDIAKGEIVWKKAAVQPRCLQRLPNGHTLIVEGAAQNNNRIVEVTPAGDEIWSHALPPGTYINRAYRR